MKKPVMLHQDLRAPSPARPGHLARRDYEYKCCGTASVFCGVESKAGREQALKILRVSQWDCGFITEGVDPATAPAEPAGRAFATAAGYIADAICRMACRGRAP